MIVYIIPAPMNKLDVKQRVSGWRSVPLDRNTKQEWRGALKQLTAERGIERVIASDLDSEAANVAGDELRIPVKTDYIYRRFNFGRFHARNAAVADGALRAVEKNWKSNPDVPIREGDSLTSYRKRFVRAFEELLDKHGTALFVTDPRTIAFIRGGLDSLSIIPNGSLVARNKIYRVTNNSSEQILHAKS